MDVCKCVLCTLLDIVMNNLVDIFDASLTYLLCYDVGCEIKVKNNAKCSLRASIFA